MPVSQRRRIRRVLYEHWSLPRLAAARSVDVLYCPGNAASNGARCAVVLGVQSMHYRFVPAEVGRLRTLYFSRLVPRSARRADLVIAVSEDIKRTFLQAVDIPASKVRVVYEGAEDSFRRPPDQEIERELAREGLAPGYMLFVSTLKPYKNADKLIRATAWLKDKRGVAPQAVIVGRDPLGLQTELTSLARSLGVEDQVRFLGGVPHNLLPSLYAGATVFVYPSSIETFGLPILEAMACGTPVVGSDRTSVPEVVGDAGLCVNPDDVPALAGAIYKVLSDNALRDARRLKGYERVKQFTWERAARATLEVFEEAHAIWRGTSAGHPRRFHEASPS